MFKKYAAELNVVDTVCESCVHFHHETDGDYGEIDCGSYCVLHDPNLRSDGDLKPSDSCDDWRPDFWSTGYANMIGGESPADVLYSEQVAFRAYHCHLETIEENEKAKRMMITLPDPCLGLTHRRPIPSKTWMKLRTFPRKADALKFAKENGFPASMVEKRHGRFEWAWVIVSAGRILESE